MSEVSFASSLDRLKESFLWAAAQGGNVQDCESLVEIGADVNWRAPEGDTPLLAACRRGHAETVAFLLAHGSDSNSVGSDSMAAIHICARRGDIATLNALLESNISVKAKTRDGRTAIDIAKECGHEHIVSRLSSQPQRRAIPGLTSSTNTSLETVSILEDSSRSRVAFPSDSGYSVSFPTPAQFPSSSGSGGVGVSSGAVSVGGSSLSGRSLPALSSSTTVVNTPISTNDSVVGSMQRPVISNSVTASSTARSSSAGAAAGTLSAPPVPSSISPSSSWATTPLNHTQEHQTTTDLMSSPLSSGPRVSRAAATVNAAKSAISGNSSALTSSAFASHSSSSSFAAPNMAPLTATVNREMTTTSSSYTIMGQGVSGNVDETTLALRKFLENEQKERRLADAKVSALQNQNAHMTAEFSRITREHAELRQEKYVLDRKYDQLRGVPDALDKLDLSQCEDIERQLRQSSEALEVRKAILIREQLEQQKEQRLCVICQENEKSVVLLPCRHLCLCEECSHRDQLQFCPLCRRPIAHRISVYA